MRTASFVWRRGPQVGKRMNDTPTEYLQEVERALDKRGDKPGFLAMLRGELARRADASRAEVYQASEHERRRSLVETGQMPKPTRCESCGAPRTSAVSWSNAAGCWSCLECHLGAQRAEAARAAKKGGK